jgi:signal transduction histidine kinase
MAEQVLSRPKQDIILLRGGEALHCLKHLTSQKGCGTHVDCQQCVIRGSVNLSICGQRVARRYTRMQIRNPAGETVTVDLLVSSVPLQPGEVLLSLENTSEWLALRNVMPVCDSCHAVISKNNEWQTAIEELRKQLLQASRQAGMAEVATSVLHNVGNVLNSVNVSATLVLDNIKKSNAAHLARAVAMLNEHLDDLGRYVTNDPKGKQLPGYLTRVSEQLAREQQRAVAELESLRENIEHIKEIVAMQQSYAKVSGVAESVKITDLVEDALRLNAGSLARHEVALVREYTDAPAITVEKHKVLQILVNLIRNAKYACDESGRTDKQITLKVSRRDQWVCVAVIDNGVGIPVENRTRIFNHGFTTRKNGHGFGLHSGALAAAELGGTLTAHSDGPGTGAAFTLELPVADGEDAGAARLHPVCGRMSIVG